MLPPSIPTEAAWPVIFLAAAFVAAVAFVGNGVVLLLSRRDAEDAAEAGETTAVSRAQQRARSCAISMAIAAPHDGCPRLPVLHQPLT